MQAKLELKSASVFIDKPIINISKLKERFFSSNCQCDCNCDCSDCSNCSDCNDCNCDCNCNCNCTD